MSWHSFKWQHTLTGPQKGSCWDLADFQVTESSQVQMDKASLKSEIFPSAFQSGTWGYNLPKTANSQ